ncbi:nitroreductase family protein [Arthrobacter sp. G119Y2]|uniref:nitroreductase family protein n=1 Tax=Arthrobacter sp. G119Y2 TaxID=3134965 RepID=UPI003119F448
MQLLQPWSDVPEKEAAYRYADLILNRVRSGLPNDKWEVDWATAPLVFSAYRDVAFRPVAPSSPGAGLFAPCPQPNLQTLTDVCHVAYGISSLRLSVNLNDRPEVHSHVSSVKWGRGSASGGGRYCVDVYLVQGTGGDLAAGLYHYSVIANGWEQLSSQDCTDELRRAQGYPFVAGSYLCYTINYWRSAFKYNDFAYQATSMDIGTYFGAIHEVLGEGVAATWDMEVDETAIARILGLNPLHDGIYAVQAWDEVASEPLLASSQVAENASSHRPPALPKDREAVDFPTTQALQRDMALEEPDYSARTSLCAVDLTKVAINRTERWRALTGRETSFGRFDGTSISEAELGILLARAHEAARSLTAGSPYRPALQFLVYVNKVEGYAPGLYLQKDDSGMQLIDEGDQTQFLEGTFFLHNYIARLASCTVILCSEVTAAAEEHGVRGYRLTNAMVGAACQSMLTEASAIGVGTGTVLGFDAAAHADHAGMDTGESAPMLMIMLGRDAPSGRVRAELCAGGSV